MPLQDFLQALQKQCLPGIWSKGVAMARSGSVRQDSASQDELTFRFILTDRPVSPKVSLWPEDEDWFCDCGDRNEICAHVAAAAAYLKTQPQTLRPSSLPSLAYRFSRKDGALHFERVVIQAGTETPFSESLVSYIGGIQSGRIRSAPLAATQEDFAVDGALGQKYRGILDRGSLGRLLRALAPLSDITLDGVTVKASALSAKLQAIVTDEPGGFRLRGHQDPDITEIFSNGAVLCDTILKIIEDPGLTAEERQMLAGPGRYFSHREAEVLVAEVLPAIEKKIGVQIRSTKLPRAARVAPKIILHLESSSPDQLSVIPRLTYETAPGETAIRDELAERALVRQLQSDLHLTLGQTARLQGYEALAFVQNLKGWETRGNGVETFALHSELRPRFEISHLTSGESALGIRFESSRSSDGFGGTTDSAQVFQAWRENRSYVPLLGGGWAPLPKDWLTKYGERISAILALQSAGKKLPSYALPELANLAEELGEPYPESLKLLRKQLETFTAIPSAKLPSDLKAELRHYQHEGVNWLCFLREMGMGAMLADDMGLGKTLQALCAARGRTLVVTPTSVLQSWADQVARFRPGLKLSRYYGPDRKLDPNADLILTTYAVLRLDQARLSGENWTTILLDEAQNIKNPESQTAKAAHSLRGDFRIALSGTPVENRLDDLWSQFQFLNPGLLGSRAEFQSRYSEPARLRSKIKPFILRRLKAQVAPELPARTEVLLHCELGAEERDTYEAILASSRKEVLETLEAGGSVFAALEALLRLRQACCHSALVPGQAADTSAKIDLLVQTLETSVALGHRSLIFSQWTSFLDLIEPHLVRSGITFSRLDGATKNRGELVEQFQKPNGPFAMLISLKAGGVGLTLTAADHIFILDPWWNPAVEDQAADRAHRIGQKNPVLIQRLVAKDTIEDRIVELQKKKRELAGAILDGSEAAATLSREDLISLLG